jgi:hypothetical protein
MKSHALPVKVPINFWRLVVVQTRLRNGTVI